MKHSIQLRRVLLGAAAVLMMEHGAVVWAQNDTIELAPVAGSRPPLGSLLPPPADAGKKAPLVDEQASVDVSQGEVATLMQLIHDAQIVELRTTYNGSYGASLFFYPPDMTWYVALFQDKRFWRVIRSQDEMRGEAIYADFARQTERLADVEIRRTQLEAQKANIERFIALSEDRARRLQADLDVARSQQAKVDARQSQMQADSVALRTEKARAQAQLQDLQRSVQQLQRATEAGLPGAPK
ncbi:DUF2968 domain-containing protein [Paraburkholderia adhaesiva]|uniref:DUF2968 domain-containing protein n=1 Tax=Paraburkholderia adhaesiva TaxID=2883244 RepID=UPI001F3619DF|nr:DUF2968 domain-containing protein [Paraburkholderia adhaesiva]